MTDEVHIAELIARQLRQEATATDAQKLRTWRDASHANRVFLDEQVREEVIIEALRAGYRVDKEATWRKFEMRRDEFLLAQRPVPVIHRFRRLAAAAVLIALVGIGGYIWMQSRDEKSLVIQTPEQSVTKLRPNGGRLLLEDGELVGVDPAVKGRVSMQGTTLATIDETNRLVYTPDLVNYMGVSYILFKPGVSSPSIKYNELYVPFGSKYELVLPDGTGVTVNAGSSLRFPVAFAGDQRVVELSGEAFFDVRADGQHPFVVQMGKQKAVALGTQFAIRSFPGEPLQTVILEKGKVRVHSEKKAVELYPGQEAQVNEEQGIRVVNVNLQNALSWKDGYFNFDDLDLRAAICQLAQWHGMKVRIEKDVRIRSLGSGNIAHSIPLPKLLRLLELPNLHFEIHDSTIIVKR